MKNVTLKDCDTIPMIAAWLSYKMPEAECPLLLEALQRAANIGAAKVQPTTPKPRCDAQGRLLSVLDCGITVYYMTNGGLHRGIWNDTMSDNDALNQGRCFISQPAAEAELIRLKCLQRLRGMEGFTPFGGFELSVENSIILDGYQTFEQRDAAKATITSEERAAFLYREPMGER